MFCVGDSNSSKSDETISVLLPSGRWRGRGTKRTFNTKGTKPWSLLVQKLVVVCATLLQYCDTEEDLAAAARSQARLTCYKSGRSAINSGCVACDATAGHARLVPLNCARGKTARHTRQLEGNVVRPGRPCRHSRRGDDCQDWFPGREIILLAWIHIDANKIFL